MYDAELVRWQCPRAAGPTEYSVRSGISKAMVPATVDGQARFCSTTRRMADEELECSPIRTPGGIGVNGSKVMNEQETVGYPQATPSLSI